MLAWRGDRGDVRRCLHTRRGVGDHQRWIDSYTDVMGMTRWRQSEKPTQDYSRAVLGDGKNPEHAESELTDNHGVSSYEPGTAYGHVAIGVPERNGTAVLRGLPPGEYYVAAVDRSMFEEVAGLDAGSFDLLIAGATRVTLTEGAASPVSEKIPTR